jgi:imidazolonepropionase-like amidohydrolase
MARSLFVGGAVFDGISDELSDVDVLVVDDVIQEVGAGLSPGLIGDSGEVINLGGRVLLPGLIDAHVHLYIAALDLGIVNRMPMSLLAHDARRRLESALQRGFTTLRDAGGADYGLQMALQRGWITGPRLLYCGHALSQTGGPRDDRRHFETGPEDEICPAHIGRVVDSPDQMRAAIRDEFRRGASFVKLMGSAAAGSSGSGADQFSDAEIVAALDEAARRATYVTAHVHPDHSVRRLVELGVPCLEHATAIMPDTARLVAERGTYVVPTLALPDGLARYGAGLGFPAQSAERMVDVAEEARRSLVTMYEAGVVLGFGSDTVGPLDHIQTSEFRIRGGLVPAASVLRSATSTNATMMGLGDRFGRVVPGYTADLIVVDGDPIADIALLDNGAGAHVPGVMLGGEWRKRDSSRI